MNYTTGKRSKGPQKKALLDLKATCLKKDRN
jgi:hypothetical protein